MTDQPRILDTWALQPTLDRGADLRHDTDALDRLWPTARLVVVDREGRFSESMGSASVGEYEPERHLFLGRVKGTPWFASSTAIASPIGPAPMITTGCRGSTSVNPRGAT